MQAPTFYDKDIPDAPPGLKWWKYRSVRLLRLFLALLDLLSEGSPCSVCVRACMFVCAWVMPVLHVSLSCMHLRVHASRVCACALFPKFHDLEGGLRSLVGEKHG